MSNTFDGAGIPPVQVTEHLAKHNPVHGVEFQTLWAALCDDSGCGVYEIDSDGVVRWANARAAELHEAGSLVGRAPSDFLAPGVAREWVAMAREVSLTGRPATLDTAIRGRGVQVTMRGIGDPPTRRVLVVCSTLRRSHENLPPEIRLVKSQSRDLGPLNSLTRRELEILGLIADGMTSGQIAKALSRSVKTIEWHRVSIGQKLGVKTRVELAELARAAGIKGSESIGRAE